VTIGHPPFGYQTVTFETTAVTGGADSLGTKTPAPVDVPVANCRHRPLKSEETPEYLSDVGTQIWKTTAPPAAAALTTKLTGRLKVAGVIYQVVGGAETFVDDWGQPFKVTVYSKIQVG
jgi:hypothetical protein